MTVATQTRAVDLNADQQIALKEIVASIDRGLPHLLTGYAGTGKTTLMQAVVADLKKRRSRFVVTAPTHKAVSVLTRKLREAGLSDDAECMTLHRLLSLRPKSRGDRQVFVRSKNAKPVLADVVIVDECSMLGHELMQHIRRHLAMRSVIFVGDRAQLPPVNEPESEAFGIAPSSNLSTIVRQAAGNPILAAAHVIRESQGGPADWSWLKPTHEGRRGVYVPRDPDEWMRKAFLSSDFAQDPDTFRYLCWTNDRVARTNAKVRSWIYGDNIPFPFMPGERVLLRAPVVRDDEILFATNEEATVVDVEVSSVTKRMGQVRDLFGWRAEVQTWKCVIRRDDGFQAPVHLVRDHAAYRHALNRLSDEGTASEARWDDFHEFKAEFATMQAVYAMTVHTSQGSTFRNAFVDVPDIRRCGSSKLLEMQQLLYVAATRPTDALVIVQ